MHILTKQSQGRANDVTGGKQTDTMLKILYLKKSTKVKRKLHLDTYDPTRVKELEK